MASERGTFRSVIFCEDVRYEIGLKKSIIGTFSGDIVVEQFPAAVQLAMFFDYIQTGSAEPDRLRIIIKRNDEEIGRMESDAPNNDSGITNIVIPKAILPFEKPSEITVFASVNGGEEKELIRKQLKQGKVEKR